MSRADSAAGRQTEPLTPRQMKLISILAENPNIKVAAEPRHTAG